MKIAADWFEAGGSARRRVWLYLSRGGVFVQEADGGGAQAKYAALSDVKISARLAGVPRRFEFPCGGAALVADNAAADAALAQCGVHGGAAYAIERRWLALLLCGVAAAAVVWLAMTRGLPYLADAAATRIDPQTVQTLGEAVYDNLREEDILLPSAEGPEQAARAQRLFAPVAAAAPASAGNMQVRLHRLSFGADDDVANALALPHGLIVPTDALMRQLSDDEALAVFAHEAGHVAHAHSVRLLLRAAATSALALFLLGDATFALAPAALAHLQYSREFEREADCYALAYLQDNGLQIALLSDALQKIEKMQTADNEQTEQEKTDEDGEDDSGANTKREREQSARRQLAERLLEALSTHPSTQTRGLEC